MAMITYAAIASLMIGLAALLWLVLANLRSGPRRSAACVVVGGLGLFVIMTLFIGPHSLPASVEQDLPRVPTPTQSPAPPGPTEHNDFGGIPAATSREAPVATPCDSGPATNDTPGIVSSLGMAPGVVAGGLEVTLLQVGVPEESGGRPSGSGASTGTVPGLSSSRIALQLVPAGPTRGANVTLRFPLADLWILPDPLTNEDRFRPQPLRAWMLREGDWHELERLSDLQIDPSATCLISVEFMVPSESRGLILYLGYQQLWAFQVSAS